MINITTTSIGQSISYADLSEVTEAVWGGIAWPCGEKAGFVIVLAAGKTKYRDGWELSVLEEFESFDVRELVRQVVAMDLKYWLSQPRTDLSGSPRGRWIADETHEAGKRFLAEAVEQTRRSDRGKVHHVVELTRTMLIEMDHLYDYILPKIAAWIKDDRKLLYLKEGLAWQHLSYYDKPDASDFSGMSIGECPAGEALGYCAIEMQAWLDQRFTRRVYTGYSKMDRGVTSLTGCD